MIAFALGSRRRRPRVRGMFFRPSRRSRGVASIELLMALGPLLLAAYGFVELGVWACRQLLALASHMVMWALL